MLRNKSYVFCNQHYVISIMNQGAVSTMLTLQNSNIGLNLFNLRLVQYRIYYVRMGQLKLCMIIIDLISSCIIKHSLIYFIVVSSSLIKSTSQE